MNPLDWLNDNSGAVQGVGAIASILVLLGLALVTRHYARETERIAKATDEQAKAGAQMAREMKEQAEASAEMAREMREQRFEGARPVLRAECRLYNGKVGHDPHVRVKMHNIGQGVALRIECRFEHPQLGYSPVWLGAVAVQEEINLGDIIRRAADDKPGVEVAVGSLAYLVLQYEDIYARLFETRVAFEQDLLGWTERRTSYDLVAPCAPADREPPSHNVWHKFKVTSSGSFKEVTDDP